MDFWDQLLNTSWLFAIGIAAMLVILKKDWKSTRIVNGLPILTSRESLYIGWQTLQNRRYAAEMVTMFKIHDGSAPTKWYNSR